MQEKYQGLLTNLTRWGRSSDQLSAAFLIGSQARNGKGADEYSDADIVLIVDDPNYFIHTDEWLKEMGNFYVSFIEDTRDGLKERRVLFEGALDVDFILRPKDTIHAVPEHEVATIVASGYQILIDKIGLGDAFSSIMAKTKDPALLLAEDFTNLVNDFWYHTVWTVKKIKRGELWTAKFCLDSYLKWKLLSLIECHVQINNGGQYNTWYTGRFLEEWADQWILDELANCFSHYDEKDMSVALFSTMNLFRMLAVDIAQKLDYPYPTKSDEYTTNWVTATLS